MSRLAGRTAIITGGASGIGAASVRLFVEEGARVLIADMQEQRGQALAQELGDAAVFQGLRAWCGCVHSCRHQIHRRPRGHHVRIDHDN